MPLRTKAAGPGRITPGLALRPRSLWAAISVFLFSALAVPAWAMLQFSPMDASIQPSTGQNAQVFTIKNTGDKEIAVRVRVTTRAIDESGKESRADVASLFSIYPSQAILKGGEERSVRITWKGGSSVSVEQAFRIIAEQLPVDLRKEEEVGVSAVITIQFRYEGALYVLPRNSSPRIVATVVRGPDGAFLALENAGTKHLVVLEPSAIVRGPDGTEYAVPITELEPIRGRNILAGSRRVLPLDLPPEFLAAKEISVEFSYKKD